MVPGNRKLDNYNDLKSKTLSKGLKSHEKPTVNSKALDLRYIYIINEKYPAKKKHFREKDYYFKVITL